MCFYGIRALNSEKYLWQKQPWQGPHIEMTPHLWHLINPMPISLSRNFLAGTTTHSRLQRTGWRAKITFNGPNPWRLLCGRGKFKYLIDVAKAPTATNPTYKIWFAENSLVHVWLINSMEPKISRWYLFLKKAKDVWDIAQRMYSDLGNVS